MALSDFLETENSGRQLWQMVISNLTPGTHPYNFSGFCMALVIQWLLEIRFPEGQTPEALGRYLLKERLGPKGYEGIANSQDIYGGHAPDMDQDSAMVDRHSGGALVRQNASVNYNTYQTHWLSIRSRMYVKDNNQPIPNDDTIRLGDHTKNYSGVMGIGGNNNILLKLFMGNTWAHAIGVHSTATHVYFFDPNYGIFIFDQDRQGDIASFLEELWQSYGVSWGDIADINPTA